jgi:hypothetical protein
MQKWNQEKDQNSEGYEIRCSADKRQEAIKRGFRRRPIISMIT